jgi:Family of unknown function (DUF6081)
MQIRTIRCAVALAVAALAPVASAAAGVAAPPSTSTVVYDDFSAVGGYTLADYNAKWSNPYGLIDMAATCPDGVTPAHGDTRSFAGGDLAIADAPFTCGADFSVFDHLKYIAISNQSFPVPALGSLQFSSDIQASTPGTIAGRVVHGSYGPPGSYPNGNPYAAVVLQGQQAGAVMNMVDFATGQLFDWFVSGNKAFMLIERLPSSVTGNAQPGSPDWVGPDKMYTQILKEIRVRPGVRHHVAIRYTRGFGNAFVQYLLDSRLVGTVRNVGVPLDQQGVSYTGIYPSLGPGEKLVNKISSFSIGHGTFSLLDAFPFQWGWSFDSSTLSWECDFANWASACNGGVSIPLGERLFGQGVNAHFDNFAVTTTG